MASHENLVIWCSVQAAVIACLGAAATWLFARRAPAAGATTAAAAAATILAVTLLAPVRMPRVELFDATPAEAIGVGSPRAGALAETGAQPLAGGGLDLRGLAAWVSNAMRVVGERDKPRAAQAGRWSWVVIVAFFGAALGLARLGIALVYVARLRRDCNPLRESTTVVMFAEIARQLGVQRDVSLCESTVIASPAVVGWRRPAVLLPPSHIAWTDEQLRAALAHELAHVMRGDFAWRAAASLATAVHFLHPLVHLLTRRFALMQELAADRLAAAVAGGSASYLRAISELAIRLDDSKGLRAEPLVLPAFSSSLMRRIVMLRSKEGSMAGGGRSAWGVMAAGLIAMVGAATTALRGAAESVEARPATAAPMALFARPVLEDPSLGDPGDGRFVVRVAELLRNPALSAQANLAVGFCTSRWRESFSVEAPRLDLSAIEYVAGIVDLTIKSTPPVEGSDQTGQMMLGTGEFVVRFVDDINWQAWFKAYMPTAEHKSEKGLAYVVLPVIDAVGPKGGAYLVSARDARTLVVAGNVDRLKRMVAGAASAGAADNLPAWSDLDGGVATMLASDVKVDRKLKTPKAEQAEALLRNVKRYGAGFDLDPATNQAGVRFDLTCGDESGAQEVLAALGELLPMMKAEIEKQVAELSAAPVEGAANDAERALYRAYLEFWQRLLAAHTMDVKIYADGSSRVRIAVEAPLPEMLFGGGAAVAAAPKEEAARR